MSGRLSSVGVALHLKTETPVATHDVEGEQDCIVLELGQWPATVSVYMTADVAQCISAMLAQHVQDRRAGRAVPI